MTFSSTPAAPEIWANIDRRLRTGDEDRWLSSRYASESGRRSLVALYGFCWELARVRLIVTEPTMGAIRFQWWRDALEELKEGKPPRAHDVATAIAHMLAETVLRADDLVQIVDAYEAAYESRDRSLEPETQMALLAARIIDPAVDCRSEIETLAPFFAARRRGEDVAGPPRPIRVPASIRPAIAHFRLRKLYRREKPASLLARRLCVLRAVMSGWL
ncbi:squalene/phytoene synthase family protein [Henriciella marina]|uniref:squalene/phytoene synthase family protein n=1 Tax=Henriciella marina TaxID=453851 RepID=UPI00146162EB|nr:squalene/phytoene synthase family protein [Henriciella marina]